jgi:hypothetical protein
MLMAAGVKAVDPTHWWAGTIAVRAQKKASRVGCIPAWLAFF